MQCFHVMKFRPPLSRQDLHDIGQRRDAVDVVPLLWEIARLRSILESAAEMQRGMGVAAPLRAVTRTPANRPPH